MQNITLPQNLISVVGSEKKDFAVKAERSQPVKKIVSIFLFGIFWTAISIFAVFSFLRPVLQGGESRFTVNGVPAVASLDNLEPLITPVIIMGIFVLVGIGMLSRGVYLLFKDGGYFVGTPTRLVHCQGRKIKSTDWEQFTGNVEINGDAQSGGVSLQLRTGKIVSQKDRADKYVPDMIYISGIPRVFEIEQICRKRIKENDPTPPATINNI